MRIQVDSLRKKLRIKDEKLKKAKDQLTECIPRKTIMRGDLTNETMEDLKTKIEAWKVLFTFMLGSVKKIPEIQNFKYSHYLVKEFKKRECFKNYSVKLDSEVRTDLLLLPTSSFLGKSSFLKKQKH